MSLMEMLVSQLGPSAVDQISKQIGGDRRSTNRAVTAAIPVLLQALNRNASNPQGAAALSSALDRDHDGGLLDSLSGFLGAPDQKMGNGILGHLLGGDRGQVEQQLGATSGLDISKVAGLLTTLAPIIMAAAGKMKRQNKLDTSGVADMLRKEEQRAAQTPDLGGLGKMLDADGDGSYVDDLAKLGGNLLGGFLGKKR